MQKAGMIEQLYQKYREEFQNEEIVLGEGSLDAKLLLIGEAPGKDEVKLSKPFVGVAGKNLLEFLNILKINRESIYITNAIKFRLSKINDKTGKVVNRPAHQEEIIKNRIYLLEEIKIINPLNIITLGNVPLKSVTGDNNINIGAVHGTILKVSLHNKEYNLFPLYHPASIIYNRSLKEVYLQDIENLRLLI